MNCFKAEESLKLGCSILEGSPPPTLTWWRQTGGGEGEKDGGGILEEVPNGGEGGQLDLKKVSR